jgi:hypothetical protein
VSRLAHSGKIGTRDDRLTRPEDASDIREFLNHLHAKGRSPRTVRIYAQAADAFTAFTARRNKPLRCWLTSSAQSTRHV